MIKNVREKDIGLFMKLSGKKKPDKAVDSR